MRIHVNGQAVDFDGDTITYEDVLWIAKQPEGASVIYIGQRHGDSRREGILSKGKAIKPELDMAFTCVRTGNA